MSTAMLVKVLRSGALLLVAACLAACFQLRGANLARLGNSSVYINYGGAYDLALQVKRKLEISDIKVISDMAEADYIIGLDNESFDRSVLTVSADTGKVEEYELVYTSSLTLTGPNKQELLKSDPILVRREYTFDEDSVLGKFDEENKLREEMISHAADMVLRRLQAATR